MVDSTPVVTVLQGDDSTDIEARLSAYQSALGSPDMASLNTTILDGRSARLDEIKSAALTMPFLAPHRLVIVTNTLAAYDGKKGDDHEKLLSLMDDLPPSTRLVLVAEDSLVSKGSRTFWEKVTPKHWLMRWVESAGARAEVIDCSLPTLRQMPNWVKQKAAVLGGQFESDAAFKLAEYVGNNTLRASQEVAKLLTYVNYFRPVSADDVILLTAQEQEGNIFDLVDAIGERQGKKALEQLQILLEQSDALEISGMITRQFRLLLQAREILDEGGGENQVRDELNLHPYLAQKLTGQARRFSIAQLEGLYRRLLQIDLDIKTGGMPGDVAFELLVTELTNGF